jgi:hypothetical protein
VSCVLVVVGELRAAGAEAGAMAAALTFQALAMAACAWALLMGMPGKGQSLLLSCL